MRIQHLFNIYTPKSRFTLIIAGKSQTYIARYWSLPFGPNGELLKRQWSSEIEGTEIESLLTAAQDEIEKLDGPILKVEESSFDRGVSRLFGIDRKSESGAAEAA